MSDTTKRVADLVSVIFEATAATLREHGESAHASVVDLGSQQQISLEVDRKRGDW